MKKEKGCGPNVPVAQALNLLDLTSYVDGTIVSRTVDENAAGSLTLFAFDRNQGVSEHSAPYDAYVFVLDGELRLKIGGKAVVARAGQLVAMPANVPHALHAETPAKMLLAMLRVQPVQA